MSLPLPAAACRKKKEDGMISSFKLTRAVKRKKKKTVMFPSDHYERDGWSYARSLAC